MKKFRNIIAGIFNVSMFIVLLLVLIFISGKASIYFHNKLHTANMEVIQK